MERYDSTAAAHYAAYRPGLHPMILRRVFTQNVLFDAGLDIGCGTGYSAVALAEYCSHVYGVDPSPSMLSRAMAHERVDYLSGTAEHIPLSSNSVDIITFAGSLFYADVGATGEEIRRVAREGATVVVYDFEILLEQVVRQYGIDPQANGSDYDHRTNLSGVPGFVELVVRSERVGLPMAPTEMAHVLLSDSQRYDQFAMKYGGAELFETLVEELQSTYARVVAEADLYYSTYRLMKK